MWPMPRHPSCIGKVMVAAKWGSSSILEFVVRKLHDENRDWNWILFRYSLVKFRVLFTQFHFTVLL